jgi:hypothetical protein
MRIWGGDDADDEEEEEESRLEAAKSWATCLLVALLIGMSSNLLITRSSFRTNEDDHC